MTKREMANKIAKEMSLPPRQVQAIVQRVFDGIIETLVEEGRIELRKLRRIRGQEAHAEASTQPSDG